MVAALSCAWAQFTRRCWFYQIIITIYTSFSVYGLSNAWNQRCRPFTRSSAKRLWESFTWTYCEYNSRHLICVHVYLLHFLRVYLAIYLFSCLFIRLIFIFIISYITHAMLLSLFSLIDAQSTFTAVDM